MAHRASEAGVPSPFAVIGLRSMTPAEMAKGRFMRAPDHEEAAESDPLLRIQATLGGDEGEDGNLPANEDLPDSGDADGNEDGGDNPDVNDQGNADEAGKPIDPPVSWGKDANELFEQLPPELQQKVVEREAQRERVVQAATTEAANAKRNALAEANGVFADERRQTAQYLEQIAAQFTPQRPDPALLAHNPQAFYQLQAEYERDVAQRETFAQQAAQARQDASQREAITRQHEVQETHRLMGERLGEVWTDPTQRQALLTNLEQVGASLGYPADLVEQASATDLQALHTAMEWKAKADKFDSLQKQNMSLVRNAKNLPKMTRPNAAQPAGSAQARATQQQRDRFKASGDVRDAAALIASRL